MSLHEANLANLLNAYGMYKGRYERKKFCKEILKLKENEIISFREVPTSLIFKRKQALDVQLQVLKSLKNYFLTSIEKERIVKALPETINPCNMFCDFVIFHKKNGEIHKTIIELNGVQHYENENSSQFAEQLSRDMAKYILSKNEDIEILSYKLTSDCEFSPVRNEITNILMQKRGA